MVRLRQLSRNGTGPHCSRIVRDRLFIDRPQHPHQGRVEGIGWGVTDQDKINLPRDVPYVAKSVNWVRVEQRFPVRVRLENPLENLMRLGASAVVEIRPEDKC